MSRTGYRMIITLDPEKLLTHGRYSATFVYNTIGKILKNVGITVIRNGIYESGDSEMIGRANDALKSETWITELIEQWLLFAPDGTEENIMGV